MLSGCVLKRKAPDDFENSPAQRVCPDGQDRLNHSHSIQDILRDNNRERLYVTPIYWTLRQLRLLRCRLALEKVLLEKGTPPSQSVVKSLCDQAKFDNPRRVIAELLCRTSLAVQKRALERLLSFYDLYALAPEYLPFYFGQRDAATIRTDGVYSYNSCALPSLAYITFDTIQTYRRKEVFQSQCKKKNTPVMQMNAKKLHRIQPPNPVEDPYIVSILIALARAQRRLTATERSKGDSTITFRPKWPAAHTAADDKSSAQLTPDQATIQTGQKTADCFQAIVVASDDVKVDSLYVYTASIPTTVLDRLDAPLQSLPSASVTVKYFRIPLVPRE